VHARFLRDFFECSVAAVVIEQVGFANHAPGTALHNDATEFAGAECGNIVEIHVNVPRDENIDEAVFIVVRPRRAGHEAASADAGFFGDIFKSAIATVAVERIAAVAGHEYVRQSIVVKISDGNAHAPAFAGEPGLLRDILKFQWGGLAVERDHRVAALSVAIDGRAIDDQYREGAAIIAINKADATAHRFDDVLLVGRGDVGDGEAGTRRYFFKNRHRRARFAGLRTGPDT